MTSYLIQLSYLRTNSPLRLRLLLGKTFNGSIVARHVQMDKLMGF